MRSNFYSEGSGLTLAMNFGILLIQVSSYTMQHRDVPNFVKMNILNPLFRWLSLISQRSSLFLKTMCFLGFIALLYGFVSPNIQHTFPIDEIETGREAPILANNFSGFEFSPVISGVTFNDPSDCEVEDGDISIIATSGNGTLEYSIDGGDTWSANNDFSSLAAGNYNIFVRNDDGTCTVGYVLNPLVLEEPDNVPTLGTITSTVPSACGLNDGFLVINASGNGTIEYSINGGLDFQLNPTFMNLGSEEYMIALRFVGSSCVSENTFLLGGSSICVDTVQVSIPYETTMVECLDSSVFQISGLITSATFCSLGNQNTVIAAALDDECVTLDPADGFSGVSPDLICLVHCFDNDPNNCDTTIVEVTVDCDDFISEDTITLPFAGNPTEVCLPLAISQAAFLDLFLDDDPYIGGISGCDQDSIVIYTYSFLFGGGFSGPYLLDSWDFNGGSFSGQFQDANQLVNFMNGLDPAGMWTINIPTSTIIGGAPGGNYGDMNITHMGSGTQSLLMTNFTFVSNGTNINLNGIGTHELIVSDPNTGCMDTVQINLTGQLPTIDTILVSTLMNTPSDNICLDGEEFFSGFISSLGVCELPQYGNVPFVGGTDSCVYYLPTQDFVGNDTFCLLACDNSIPQICDTTIVIVSVGVPNDTLFLSLPNDEPIDTCLAELIQLPNILTSDICNINATEIAAIPNNDCITLDPNDGFIGTTEVCVVHCDDSSPAVCDTTILIVNVADPCTSFDIIPVDEMTIGSLDGNAILCLPIPFDQIDDYSISVNGTLVTSTGECDNGLGSQINFNVFGNFEVIVTDVSGCSDTVAVESIQIAPPPLDFVFIEAPGTQPFDTCLTSDILQLPGNIISAEICGIFSTDVAVSLDEECATIDLEDDFLGMTQVCVVHCDDSVPSLCDTTILIINSTILCDDIFSQDDFVIVSPDSTVEICLPILPEDIDMFDVMVDGLPYINGYTGCDFDSAHIYGYALIFGQGNDGPYDVTWNTNGQQFMSTVQNIAELVDSMNVWDPLGEWIDEGTTLFSPNLNGDYGQIIFVHVGTMLTTTIQSTLIGIPMSIQIIVNGFGDHIVTIQNTVDGCEDELHVLVIDENEILNLSTIVNTVSDTFCLDTTMLNGVNSFVICDSPNNGTINPIGVDCFSYTPNLNYEGLDTACVAICDVTGLCDTTFVFITVEPICSGFDLFTNDTLSLITDNCQIPAEYCLPVPLDAIVNLSILDNGNVYAGGLSGCDNDTCLAYTYFTIPGFGNVGPYELDSWTIDGVGTFDGQFQDIQALVDSMNLWDNMGTWELNEPLFLITNCGTNNTYSDIIVNQISTGANGMAELNIQLFPNGTQIQLDTGFHELVFIDMILGCEDTLLVQVDCQTDSTGCGIMALSDEFINVSDCDTMTQFCLDVSIFEIGNFTIMDNGVVYTGAVQACDLDPNNVAMVLDTGFHQLVLADTIKGCSDTFNIVVSCQTIDDILIEEIIPVGETVIFCLEDYGIEPSVIDSISYTCIDMQTGNANFVIDEMNWCLEITGDTIGLDTACFKVFFADTCLTIEAFIEVTAPCTQELFPQDNIGLNLLDCSVGEGEICLPILLPQLSNQLIQVNGVPYMGELVPCNFDSIFSLNCINLPSSGNLGPYILDSWIINGNDATGVFDDCDELVDLMNMLDPTGNWERIGTLITGGNSNSTYGPLEITQDLTGAVSILPINSSFIPLGTAITLPIGTFSLTFQDTTTGCRDTLITTLDCLNTEIFEGTILVGATDTLCFDTTELIGNLATIENVCEDASGEFVLFEILNDTCITYTGIEPGLDSACIILCDDLGLCDTTYVYITTLPSDDMLPIAVNDTVTSGMDLPIGINVLENDIILNVQDFFILNQPNNGDVLFLPDGTANYVPDPGYCDSVVPDSFTYVVCNPIGCDTATVFVYVECTELIVYDGFSPNNDGVNETFVIQGLNLFGNHKVYVFNRWGERVYESENYQNDWDGTWEGKDLPDGTYFYMIEIDGEDTRTGYIQLNR